MLKHLYRLFWLLACCLWVLPAHAVYVNRYSTITNGAITFTGNAIGLDKAGGQNAPGTAGGIGTFMALNPAAIDGTFPAGTTADWRLNGSSATLNIPAGSTILYAELIWSGSYSYGGENVSAFLDTPVTFITPSGSSAVTPTPATAARIGTPTVAGTCSGGPCFYVRSANVTSLVAASGSGTYTLGGMPATQSTTENNANTGGWTLAVVYQNGSLPSRNLTLFVGSETGGSPAASVSGFCTPPTGPRSGRLLVSAIEGDAGIAGDEMRFAADATALGLATARLSGPNNQTTNFFAGQINNDTGNLDTSGTFGNRNHLAGGPRSGSRQGYDITNVDISPLLVNNQTTALARGTTTGDQYMINALGLQINVGAPIFPVSTKTVDRPITRVGEILTYTIGLDNASGTADATNVTLTDNLPPGTSFVTGSMTLDGATLSGNLATGVNVGTIAAGTNRTLRFQVRVDSIPNAPTSAQYDNRANWTYQFIPCAGQPTVNGVVTTNPAATQIARLALSKQVTPTGSVNPNQVLTYTIQATNDGTAASSGSTLQDAIPAGTSYVAGSTRLNGISVPDIAGSMPYAGTALIQSVGQAGGVIAVGQTATVTFSAQVNPSTTGTITNTARADVDGPAGPAPSISASVNSPVGQVADLSLNKSGPSSATPGSTIVYSLTVRNSGPSAAPNSRLVDVLPTGLTINTAVCSAVTGGAVCPSTINTASNTLDATIPTLPSGGSVTFNLSALVANNAVGTLVNTANISTASGITDPTTANNQSSASTIINPTADLVIVKTGPSTAFLGTAVSYRIELRNQGPSSANGASFSDPVPSALSGVSASCESASGGAVCPSAIAVTSNVVTADLTTFPAGGSVVLIVNAVVANSTTGSITNTATLTAPSGTTDPTTANNASNATTTISSVADFSVIKTGPSVATPGGAISYNVVVTNAGPSPVSGATLNDAVPSGLTGLLASCTAASGGAVCPPTVGVSGSNVSANLGLMPVNSTLSFVISGTVSPAATGALTNSASVTLPVGITDSNPANNSSTTAATVNAAADLSIVKTGPSTVQAGASMTYTIVLRNSGPSDVFNASFSDASPTALSGVIASCLATTGGATCPTAFANSGTAISATLPVFPVGSSITLQITGTVSGSTTGTISNSATVATPAAVPDNNQVNNLSSVTTTITPVANLRISKTGPASVAAGDGVVYNMVVVNDGPSSASGAQFTDSVPAQISGVGASCGSPTNGAVCPTSVSVAGNNVSAAITNLPAGGSVTFTISGTTSPSATGSITNTANVAPPAGVTDPNLADNSSSANTPLNAVADLRIVKTGPTTVNAGGTISYSLLIQNLGPSSANNTSFSDAISSSITGVAATCGSAAGGAVCTTPSVSSNTVSGTIATLPAGGQVVITITGQVSGSASGALPNTAIVNAAGGVSDPNSANNQSSISTNVVPVANLRLVKSAPTAVNAGASITYVLRISNQGPSPANNSTFTDSLPVALSGATAVCQNPTGGAVCPTSVSVVGNTVSGAIASLPSGASVEIAITATVAGTATGTVVNTASISPPSGTTDPDNTDNTSTVGTTVTPVADVSIVKVGPSTFTPATAISYQMIVRNAGPSSVTGLVVSDLVPNQISGVSATCGTVSGGASCPASVSVVGNAVTATLPALPAGGQLIIVVTGTVAPSAIGTITNSASLTLPSGLIDPDSTNNTSTVETPVTPTANLSIVKQGPSAATPGSTITYQLVIRNAGPSAASASQFADQVPASITGLTASCSGASGGAVCPSSIGISSNNVTGIVPTLPSGSSLTISITGTVSASATGSLTNTATVTPPAGTTDPQTADNSSTVVTPLNPTADLVVTKVKLSPTGLAQPRSTVRFQIELSNNGPSNVTGVQLNDPVASGFASYTWTCSTSGLADCDSTAAGTTAAGSGAVSLPNIQINAGTGNRVIVVVDAVVADSALGTLTNTATATLPAGTTDSNPTNNSATASTGVQATADVVVSKTAPATVNAGADLTYTIVVSNAGPSAANGAVISDSVPAGLVNLTASCSNPLNGAACPSSVGISGNQVTALIPLLPATGSLTISITGTVSGTAPNQLTNTATTTLPPEILDPTPSNNSTAITTVVPVADLSVVKFGPSAVNAGATISYSIVLRNAGPSPAINAAFSDAVPASVTGLIVSCANETGGAVCPTTINNTANTLSALIPNLPPSSSVTITVAGTVAGSAVGSITNTATLAVPNGTIDPDPSNNSSTEVTQITPTANIGIVKSTTPTVNAGGEIVYQLLISNAGPSRADDTAFSDVVPSSVTVLSGSCGSAAGGAACPTSVGVTGNNVSGTIPSLPSGGSVIITITGRVGNSAVGTISNTASVTPAAGVIDPSLGDNSSTSNTPINLVADVRISKLAPVAIQPLQTLTFRLLISNAGPSSAHGTTFTDTVPASITGLTATCANPAGGAVCPSTVVVAGNTVSGTIASLPAGGAVEIQISGTVLGSATGVIANVASVAAPVNVIDLVTDNNTSSSNTTINATADLTVVKTGPASVQAGGAISYTITVANAGPSAADGTAISDIIPANIINPSAICESTLGLAVCPATVGISGNNFAATIPALPSGGQVVFRVNGTVLGSATGTLTNSATLTPPANVTDSSPNNTASTTATIIPVADLSIVKTAPPSVNAGAGISYQLRVRNNGPSSAIGSVFSDTLPSSISSISASCTSSSGAATCPSNLSVVGNTVGGTLTTFPNGGEVIITIVGQVSGAAVGVINNTATVTPPNGTVDPLASNNTSSTATPINPIADLQVIKTGPASVNAGAAISYNIRVINQGPSSAGNTAFSDLVPSGIGGVSATCGSANGGAVCPSLSVTGNAVDATIATLPAGGSLIFTVSGTVAGDAPANLLNTARVTPASGVTDPDITNNSSVTNTAVQPVADLRVTKSGPASANAGSVMTYNIVAINQGPSAANGAVLLDPVPTSITGVSATCIGTSGGATCPTPSVVGNNVSATLANFPAGATVSLSVSGTVTGIGAGASGASITNSVSISSPSGVLDPDTTNNTALSNSPFQPVADVRVSKTATPVVNAGGAISWQIVVANDGPSPANNTTLTDVLPATVSNPQATCTSTSGGGQCPTSISLTGNNLSAQIETLPAGGSVVFTVNASVLGSTTGVITNSASVAAAAGIIDPSAGNNTASANSSVTPVSDLRMSKTATPNANAGGAISYTLEVTNAGPSAAPLSTVVDQVPAEITGVTATCAAATGGAVCPASVGVAGNAVSATIPTLPAGGTVRFTVLGTVSGAATGTIANTASVQPPAGTIDPDQSNDSGSATTAITPVTDLLIEKTTIPALNAGDPIRYIVKVTNLGPSRANEAVFTDVVPTVVSNLSAVCDTPSLGAVCPSSMNIAGQTVTATIPSMPLGSSVVFTITGGLLTTASGNVANTATIAPAVGFIDPNPANNSSTATTLVTPLADLSVVKRRVDSAAVVNPASVVTYEIVVRNAGPASITGLGVVDNLPASLSNATWTCSVTGNADCDTSATGNGATGSGNVNLGQIAIGPNAADTVVIRLAATLSEDAIGVLVNTASMILPPSVVDPNPNNNTSTDSVTVAAVLNGSVFTDVNGDAQRSNTDGPIAGLTVTLIPVNAPAGTPPIVVTTNALGQWLAPVQANTAYQITVAAPPGMVASTRNNPQTVNSAALGVQATVPSVGFTQSASLSGSIWRDLNHNRSRDGGEPNVQGFRVEVLDATSQVVATALTDANGQYTIAGLLPSLPNDPTTLFSVRFVDPANNVIYGRPLSQDPSLPNGDTSRGVIEKISVAPGVNLSNQSLPLDPSGVVYNVVTREPVAGAVVTFSGPTGFNPNTHLLGGATAATQTTGPNGYYEFWLLPDAPAGVYSLSVVAPAGLRAPSAQVPAQVGDLDVPLTAGIFAVQPQAGPPSDGQSTRYFMRFKLSAGADHVVNNHIPLDPEVPTELFVTKSANRAEAEIGDAIRYTIAIRHRSGPAASAVQLVDRLPAGFRYVPGTSQLQVNVSSPRVALPEPSGSPGPNLSFALGRIEPGQTLLLTYAVRIGVGSQQGDGINRAQAVVGNTQSNLAQAQVKINDGVFHQQACVVGKVFHDCNNNHVQDGEEIGIPGIRIYVQNGLNFVTDSEGKYSFCGLEPRTHVFKVDPSTLPAGSRLTTSSNRNAGDAQSLFVDPKFGEMVRADFIEGSCKPAVIEETKSRRKKGETREIDKLGNKLPNGSFVLPQGQKQSK